MNLANTKMDMRDLTDDERSNLIGALDTMGVRWESGERLDTHPESLPDPFYFIYGDGTSGLYHMKVSLSPSHYSGHKNKEIDPRSLFTPIRLYKPVKPLW